jgi:hypothetical protein
LMAILGKEIQVSLANLGDFHGGNYRIGTRLGQTLDKKMPTCLTIPQHH